MLVQGVNSQGVAPHVLKAKKKENKRECVGMMITCLDDNQKLK
jgi:hypothetical protein